MNAKAFKGLRIGAWAIFGLLSSLIIAESATPTDASGRQSFSFSQLVADFINLISPTKQAETLKPTGITAATSSRMATLEDGTKAYLFNEDEAIVGTTKLYTYSLTYPEQKADNYETEVKLEFVVTPGKDSFTHNLNTAGKSGVLRIIPLMEGDYTFRLTDASGNVATSSFTAKKRIVPKDITSDVSTFNLKVHELAQYRFKLSFGDLNPDGEEPSHYLARYWDPKLTPFTSSDESVFKVEDGGLLEGIGVGDAWLKYKDRNLCRITVAGNYEVPNIASLKASSSKTTLAPLDYDYPGYGGQLSAKFYDALGNEIVSSEPIGYESEDPLIAKVDEKGFVSGYRKSGNTRVKVYLQRNPSIYDYVSFSSSPALPTKATIQAKCGDEVLPLSGGSVHNGSSIELSADFEPINTSDKRLHVTLSDASKATLANNDSNTPSIAIHGEGEFSFTVMSIGLGETSKKTYSLFLEPRQAIEPSDMGDFHAFIRKAAGHFLLFFVTGIFGGLAFLWTFFRKKKWGKFASAGLAVGSGILLASLSEAIQAIPALHRGASFMDVLIDALGFFIAVAIVLGIYCLVRYLKDRKQDKESPKE